MRYVKMLGLAAVAAAALMAFVGASSASATVLCKTTPVNNAAGTTFATCPEGWAYPSTTTVHAVAEETLKLTTSFKNIECKKGTVHFTTENEGSASETVRSKAIEVLTFEECNCEVKVVKPGKLEIHWIKDTENGTVTSKEAEVTATCSSIFGTVHCIYATENGVSIGDLTGGEEATLDIKENNIPRLSTNALCAEQAQWDGKYKVTEPKPLYVANET